MHMCMDGNVAYFVACSPLLQVCAADIHPASTIGKGILMASGCDIGTAFRRRRWSFVAPTMVFFCRLPIFTAVVRQAMASIN